MAEARTVGLIPRAAYPDGSQLQPPWPNLVIAAGRQTVALALAIKRASADVLGPGGDPSLAETGSTLSQRRVTTN